MSLAAMVLGPGVSAGAAAEEAHDASTAAHDEYLVKAAFLYHLAMLSEWPREAFTDAAEPLLLCVLGEDRFGPALDIVAGKRVGTRTIAIARLEGVGDAGSCHLLFVSESEIHRLDSIFQEVARRPVLTVSDIPGFARMDGIIGLTTVSNKLRFRINLDGAARARLTLGSKLLALAD